MAVEEEAMNQGVVVVFEDVEEVVEVLAEIEVVAAAVTEVIKHRINHHLIG